VVKGVNERRAESLWGRYIPANERHPEWEDELTRVERDLYEKYVSGQRLTVRERLSIYSAQDPTLCHWFSWCWRKPLIIGLPLTLLGIALMPVFSFVDICLLLVFWGED